MSVVSDRPVKREFSFSVADFHRIRSLIRDHAGIQLGEGKQDMVYSRLSRRLRETGLTCFTDYLDLISYDREEWQHFVNSLTTNLTSFFREDYHFPILKAHLQQHHHKRARLWCCAASTGEEPYSMAMTLIEALGPQADAQIIATDIDTEALAQAESGIYPIERLRHLPPARLVHFQRGIGTNAGYARVSPEVRRLVQFQALNLLAPNWGLSGPFDAIFCRNVLIYFTDMARERTVRRFRPLLGKQGLLFVGHSETLNQAPGQFRLRGQTVYEPWPGQEAAQGMQP